MLTINVNQLALQKLLNLPKKDSASNSWIYEEKIIQSTNNELILPLEKIN